MALSQHVRDESPPGALAAPEAACAEGLHGATALPGRQARPWWAPLLTDGVRPLLVLSDVGACVLASALTPSRPLLGVYFTAVLLVLLWSTNLYRSRLTLSVLDDLPRLAQAWLMTVALMELGAQLVLGQFVGVQLAAVAGITLVVFRAVSYQVVRLLRRRRVVAHPTVVVGTDFTGRVIARQMRENPQCGLEPLGFVDEGGGDARASASLPAPLLGGSTQLTSILERFEPRALVVAHSSTDEDRLVEMIRACHRHHCEVFVLPRLYQVTHVGHDMDAVGNLPLVRLRRAAYRSSAWRVKRLFDVVVSTAALVLLAPVMLACALAVLVEGGRGVIFRQERVGVDGRRFQVLKFRSLRPVDESESQTQWNISHDNRLGPVGRTLRTLSLDELPQLINILRGDMSLVGPRPERPHFVAEFDRLYGGYAARHRVPSGLTGWAQVHGLRGDTSIEERARLDNFYIENWSLWLDLKIILLTVVSLVRSPGS